jgi:choline dehydrogenase-like flavoprotein
VIHYVDRQQATMELARIVSTPWLQTIGKRNPCPPGSVTQETSGACLGDDPKTSVLDHWNRCRDIRNLLVVDAECFTSDLEKSVTLLIMGLSLRASEHLAEETRLGNA